MAIATASCGLNGDDYLAQPLPTTDPTPSGKVIMVYGGSTSVDSMTTQLATAAGIRVIALASPKNFGFCRECGASDVFDYIDSNVVDEVVKAVGNDRFVGIFECISSEDIFRLDLAVMEKLGGGRMASSQPPPQNLPSNVKATWLSKYLTSRASRVARIHRMLIAKL